MSSLMRFRFLKRTKLVTTCMPLVKSCNTLLRFNELLYIFFFLINFTDVVPVKFILSVDNRTDIGDMSSTLSDFTFSIDSSKSPKRRTVFAYNN